MTIFVQQHLAEILRPFAAHVAHLQAAASRLHADAEVAQLGIDDHTTELSNHASLFKGLRRDVDATPPQLDALRRELAHACAEREALRQEAGRAAEHVRRVDEQHRATADSLMQLRQEVQGVHFTVGRLKTQVAGLEPLVDRTVHAAVESLHGKHDALERAHTATARSLQDAAKFGEDTHKVVRRLGEVHGRKGKEHGSRLDHLDTGAAKLAVFMRNDRELVQGEAAKLEGTKASVARLQNRVDQTLRAQTTFENWQQETTPKVKELLTNVGLVTMKVDNLLVNLGATESKALRRFVDDIAGLEEAVGKQLQALGDLGRNVEGHAQRLQTNEERIDKEHAEVSATLHETDGRIRNLADSLGRSEEKDRLEKEGREREAEAEKKLIADRLDALSAGLASADERLQTQLPPLREGLDAACQRVQGVEHTLSSTGVQVTKLSGSLDLTQEYWKGLTRGFRETHRSVAVDQELILAPPPVPASSSLRRPGAGLCAATSPAAPLPALHGAASPNRAAMQR